MRAAVFGLVPRHFARIAGVRDVDHVQAAVRPTQTDHAGSTSLLARREDLVTHEDVLPVSPGGVRAPDEPRAARKLHLLVELVQVVLVLQYELRMLRRAALDPAADIEDDEAIVPVRQRGETVPHVDVVEHASGLRTLHLPARHLPGVVRVAEIDHPHRPRRVIREVHVPLVHVGAVHTARDRFRELGDRLGVGGVLEREDHDAVLAGRRPLAGQHAVLAVLGGHDIVHDAGVHDHRVGDRGLRRIGDVDGVHAVADGGHVSVLAVRVHPDLARVGDSRSEPGE